jgi:para-aminobenzoate synthetase component 1
MLNWANRFNICALLDNHQYQSQYHNIECILAVDPVKSFYPKENALEELRNFINSDNDWLFGHVSYDFKNQLSATVSLHFDGIGFPDVFFFLPETVMQLQQETVIISCLKKNPESVFAEIQGIENSIVAQQSIPSIQPRISKKDYLYTINQLRQHILRGDCYEINFCQEFFATDAGIDPIAVYGKLSEISPNPFSCYYKLNDKYLLCASPERYIKKTGSKILSQPIKGTNKRSSTLFEDEQLKQDLISSEKDKSENVMIVDLVRNDLSKICQEGSVQVEELFGIYPFPQVYQMVSTISGQLQDGIDFTDVLTATFPMGSMTGAPKKRVMELIEQYEQTKRGIYSGCVGYISPEKDYDFNVVIRSIMYNYSNKYLSYQVGGGITFYSDAEKEYEECLLKAEAMKKVLQ